MHTLTLRSIKNDCGVTGFSWHLANGSGERRLQGAGALAAYGVVVLLLSASGCEREEIRAYQVSKEPPAKMQAQGPASPSSLGGASGLQSGRRDGVVWTLPPGWTERPATQAMRIATIEVGEWVGGDAKSSGLEIAVTAFPGDVGGRLANVNRWRGQMGQAAITEAELARALKEVKSEGAAAVAATRVWTTLIAGGGTVDGTQALLGAIIEPGDGQTWFLKCLGPREKVEALRPAFESFALTFRLGESGGGDGAGQASRTTPSGAPAASATPSATNPTPLTAGASISQRLATWKPPATWTEDKAGAGQFAAIAYNTSSEQGAARVTVTSLQGDGGGMLANINRWRVQVGLPGVAGEKEQPSRELAPGATLFDLARADGSDRMLSAVVSEAGATWYFKLRGSSKAVEAQAGAFEAFVRAVGIGAAARGVGDPAKEGPR